VPKSGETRAQANRKIRQDALREQLAGQKHIEQVIDNVRKIETLDPTNGADTTTELNILKTATELRLKLVNKYLPDLKATEITGEAGAPISVADMSTWSEEQLDAYITSHQ
jgi:hypothetical protein